MLLGWLFPFFSFICVPFVCVLHLNKKFQMLFIVRYHIPRSWFKPSENVLVIFEEKGGDPTQIRFSKRKISGACAHVSEDHPSFDLKYFQNAGNNNGRNNATVQLECPTNAHISAVKFASFGTPTGSCGSYAQGDCHDPNSASLIKKVREKAFTFLLLLQFFPFISFMNIFKEVHRSNS